MTENQKLDSAWIGWNEVMRKVASLMRGRDFAAALSEVEAFLARERNPELRSDALGMRADLRE